LAGAGCHNNGRSIRESFMIPPRQFLQLFVKAGKSWSDDYAPSMGAAISYYTVFSLAPLLVIVIAIAGAVFGREAVQGQLVSQLSGLMGAKGAELIQSLVAATSDTDKGLVASLISGVVLIVGATSVFAELQNALDRVWHVPASAKPGGVFALLRARLLSIGMILGLVFLLMVSLAVSAAVAAFGALTSELMPGAEILLQVLNLAISFGIATLLFAMIYKVMPSTRIAWRDVWVGAVTTAVLFEIGKFLIGLYIGKSSMTESFAAAGSLVVLIAWVYYAAQIFLFGAEFTKVYAQQHGSRAGMPADATPPAGPAKTEAASVPPRVAAAEAALDSNREAWVETAAPPRRASPAMPAPALPVPAAGVATAALVVLASIGAFAMRSHSHSRSRPGAGARSGHRR
jgi:membrane protein